MPSQNNVLPTLTYRSRGPGGISWPINSRPERGKGIIYSIQWGFQVGSTYPVRGEYVGLTSLSAQERFNSHMKKAGQLTFTYAEQNKRRKSIIKGKTKTPEPDQNAQNIFYMALRTGMGLQNRKLSSQSGYRFLKVLAHVSAYDLAAAEVALIKARGTHGSFDVPSMEQLMRAPGNYAHKKTFIGFNQSPGGENSIVKRPMPKRDRILAAVHFLNEGRGSLNPPSFLQRIPDSALGIGRQDLAFDVFNVIKYFAGDTVESYEQQKLKNDKKTGRPVLGITENFIREELKRMGVKFTPVRGGETKRIDIGDKQRFINVFITTPRNETQSLFNLQRKIFVQRMDSIDPKTFTKATPTKVGFSITGERKASEQAARLIKKGLVQIQPYVVQAGYYVLESMLQKVQPGFKFSPEDRRKIEQMSEKHSMEYLIETLMSNPLFKKADKEILKKTRSDFIKFQKGEL